METNQLKQQVITLAGKEPKLESPVYLMPSAYVIGDVTIGPLTSLWFNTTVRGDMHHIVIGSQTNIQDGTVVHVTHDTGPTYIGSKVTIGHQCIIHACTIEDACLIGMGAIILDNAKIGKGCLIGAGSLITSGTEIPPGTLAFGRPAKAIRDLTADEQKQIAESAAYYVKTAQQYPFKI